ncbi:hypothetical protein EGT41_08395 [Burkholderia cenocepacia]|uniref:Uncharacterized protein n=1 Tax=Burkholderia cenocepacia TaxID=95486 RepID=A0A3R9BHJ1_9BURK|nr:hypothetical protein EGT41_08395 [Burkholderia cenocepacia]
MPFRVSRATGRDPAPLAGSTRKRPARFSLRQPMSARLPAPPRSGYKSASHSGACAAPLPLTSENA